MLPRGFHWPQVSARSAGGCGLVIRNPLGQDVLELEASSNRICEIWVKLRGHWRAIFAVRAS